MAATLQQKRKAHPITDELYDRLCVEIRRVYVDIPEIVYIAVWPAHLQQWRAICDHGVERVITAADLPIQNAVFDVAELPAVEGVAPIRIAAGQCPECGRVHWAIIAPDRRASARVQ